MGNINGTERTQLLNLLEDMKKEKVKAVTKFWIY